MHYKATIQYKQHYSKNTKSYVWLKREKKKIKLKTPQVNPITSDPNKRYIKQKKDQILKEILIYNNNKILHYSARRKQAEDWEFGEQRQSQHQNLIGKQKQEIWEQRPRKPNTKNIQVNERWGDVILYLYPIPFRL